jgi:hypothetical protein
MRIPPDGVLLEHTEVLLRTDITAAGGAAHDRKLLLELGVGQRARPPWRDRLRQDVALHHPRQGTWGRLPTADEPRDGAIAGRALQRQQRCGREHRAVPEQRAQASATGGALELKYRGLRRRASTQIARSRRQKAADAIIRRGSFDGCTGRGRTPGHHHLPRHVARPAIGALPSVDW